MLSSRICVTSAREMIREVLFGAKVAEQSDIVLPAWRDGIKHLQENKYKL